MIYFYTILAMLNLVAIILVINEDIFYEVGDKVFKIFWILILPYFGAIFAMWKLHDLHDYTVPKSDLNTTDNTREYDIVDSLGGFDGGE